MLGRLSINQFFASNVCKCYILYKFQIGDDFMVDEIILNHTPIHVTNYHEEMEDGLHKICVDFNVTSKDYHDITKLLYKGVFDVQVPQKGLTFTGDIQQYSTSITNLYQEGNVGDFRLCLRERNS